MIQKSGEIKVAFKSFMYKRFIFNKDKRIDVEWKNKKNGFILFGIMVLFLRKNHSKRPWNSMPAEVIWSNKNYFGAGSNAVIVVRRSRMRIQSDIEMFKET